MVHVSPGPPLQVVSALALLLVETSDTYERPPLNICGGCFFCSPPPAASVLAPFFGLSSHAIQFDGSKNSPGARAPAPPCFPPPLLISVIPLSVLGPPPSRAWQDVHTLIRRSHNSMDLSPFSNYSSVFSDLFPAMRRSFFSCWLLQGSLRLSSNMPFLDPLFFLKNLYLRLFFFANPSPYPSFWRWARASIEGPVSFLILFHSL